MRFNWLPGSPKSGLEERWPKIFRKKLCYFRLLPNLANHLPSSSPCGLLTVTHRPRIRKFWILWRVAGNFCEPVLRIMKVCIDECQPNTSQANYSEGFWRITSNINAKIEVRKHLESVHVNRSKSAIAELCATCSWNGDGFLPVLPSLRFWPSNSCLFWWILSANSCLLVSNSILFWESRKQSVLVREVNMWSRVDAKGLW